MNNCFSNYLLSLPIQIVNWIKSFLHKKFYKVKINSSLYDSYLVLSVIPQGSVLGPLLFIMYINDLADICTKDETDIYLYADDAKIYKHVFSNADQDQLQMSLSKLHDWSNTWLLSMNAQNCKVVSYGRHADKNY